MEPYNATVDLLERNLRPECSSRTYLHTDDGALSYAEVAARADDAGAGLIGLGLGLARGDRVLLALEDSVELVASFWGAIKAGLVPVPVAPSLTATELAVVVADCRPRAVVFGRALEPALAAVDRGAAYAVAVTATAIDGAIPFGQLRGPLAAAATNADDVAFGLYTSGTTGAPKSVWHRHASLRASPDGLARQVLQLGPDDVVLSVSRMFFAYGLGNSVFLPPAYGASAVVGDFVPSAAQVAALVDAHGVTQLLGIPSFYAQLSALPELGLASLRRVVSAGEALPGATFSRFAARRGLPILDGFGCTEALVHVTCNRIDDAVPDCAGRALDGFQVEVREGELWVSGPTIPSGWLRTGDLAELRDGRVYHRGRIDDLMKVNGTWVVPGEIEQLLCAEPGVDEAAVVVIDDPLRGALLKAFIRSSRADADLHPALRSLCQARLPPYKVPRLFETVAALPHTRTGKLRRFTLRGETT